ncbi:protease [Flavobacteriaceae bacterium AU392]|nr:protease [Flavobacteriaceae bacterium]RKM81307.1 protease [Flavobacteriaceae bacterium AU392]
MKLFSIATFRFFISISITFFTTVSIAQGTRLLRQPTISNTHIAFTYGGDLWVTPLNSTNAIRLTSTAAVESDPHFSPDGQHIAFTSNRSGSNAVYTVSVNGGDVTRLTWHPSAALARGWTPDGKHILYATSRNSAPSGFNRLWTVSKDGGPSTMLNQQWGARGSFSPNGKQIAIDRVSRWDTEWQEYRGGQNTPLIVLDLKTNEEVLLPNEKTTDVHPLWMGDLIYFLSDRDFTSNLWSFNPKTKDLTQVTTHKGSDIKAISGNGNLIAFERDGYLHTLNPSTGNTTQLQINVTGDFPWAETKWEDVSRRSRSASLSPNAKRAIVEARGEIFTIPVENGNARNITQNSNTADRAPIWSPKGDEVAWFSDAGGKGYSLMIANQDGLSKPRSISIGESKLGWEPTWSPDAKYIAFVDDDVRIRIVDLEVKSIKTVDVGGNNLERGRLGLTWSKDSQWLAYAKSGSNNFRQVHVWSLKDNTVKAITNAFADSFSPSWDTDGHHLYFLASTNLALGSGWANTSAITANPNYAAYVVNLRKDDPSTFKPKSDEESVKKEDKKSGDKAKSEKDSKKEDNGVTIDFEGIERRTDALPMPVRNYGSTYKGAKGTVFISERIPNSPGVTLHKYSIEKGKAAEFTKGASQISVSTDGKHMLARIGSNWKVIKTSGANAKSGKTLKVDLKMKLNRAEEWSQMFEEAWRYERDYFYDPNLHGRDWNKVYKRYAPLIPFVKHRSDLNYILDQMNGELSVGHSFVRGGDFPRVDRSTIGLLGADLVADKNRWKITRIYTTESWNPGLSSPLDRPELKIEEGYYLVGINGKELTANDDPYQFLDGTAGQQTILHINKVANFKDSWKEIVEPIRSENALRQRAWVEDNRRLVDKLSNGKLAYIWVPNTGGPGFVSFNRYYFAQQDKQGAVIDERFNGGGLLDDYMVDLMTRSLRAGLTNEVPNGQTKPMRLPAGILGPKVLLINELAGSGGDFFPWVFRQQNAGPLIGATTWGGLVKSSTHYALIDGGSLTAPDNAVFDPINNKWVAENEGVAPDIAVRQDAKALNTGRDPQLERAVKEALRLLQLQGEIKVRPPAYSTPAVKKN